MSFPTIDDVQDAVAAAVQALGLAFGSPPAAIPVVKGKQPRQQTGTSANVQITVSAAQRPREVKRFTSLHDLHTFRLQVVGWTPGNADNTSNSVANAAIEDALRQAFNKKPVDLLGIDDLRDVRAQTATYLDRSAFVKGWDVQGIDVEIDVVRAR